MKNLHLEATEEKTLLVLREVEKIDKLRFISYICCYI